MSGIDWTDLIGEEGSDAKRDTGATQGNKKGVRKKNGKQKSGNKGEGKKDTRKGKGGDDKDRGDGLREPDQEPVVENAPALPAPGEADDGEGVESDFEEFDAGAYEWEEPGTRGGKKRTTGISGEDAEELVELATRAHKATLMQEINKELLQQRKIEQETLKLEKEAGEVMQLDFAEFLFLGYIEKANIDFCGMTKKLKAQIVSLATEKDGAGIVRLIEKEVTSILKTIKRNQKRDLTAWKRENARARSGAKKKGSG